MSGAIKCQLANAIKGLAQLKEKKNLEIILSDKMLAFERCIRLQSQIGKIRSEIRTGNLHLAEIRAALSSWTDLLRKLSGEERQTANEEFEKYQAKQSLSDLVSSYERSLRELAELESEISIDLQLAEVVKEGEARKADLAHAQAMADATARATTTGGSTGSTFGTIYQLPTLKLKAFSGDRRKWPEFYESFRAAVDKRPGSDVEKLTLLRTLLEGEPRELIAGFKLIDKNYQEALKLLKDSYGDKGAYIRGLHSELAGLKHATTVDETRHLSLELERIARELKNAGEDIEGPAIYLMLEKKLNKNFLRTILTKKAEDVNSWNTAKFRETLLDAVQKETSIQEVMAEFGMMKKPAQTTTQPSKKKDEKKLEYTYAAADGKPQPKSQFRGAKKGKQSKKPDLGYIAPELKAKSWPPPCAFCQQSHWNKECTTFTTAQARINAARQAGRCLKCLRIGHDGRNCRRPTKCFHCKKEHPTAICCNAYNNLNTNVAANQLLNVTNTRGSQHSGTTQTSVMPAVQQNVVQRKGTKALLMTLEATVFNPARPQLSTLARIFLDPGSHRSFVTAEMANRLQLPVIATEQCELCTFGEKKLKNFASDLVRLSLLANGGERITLNVNKLNFVVNPMPIFTLADLEKESLEQLKLNPPSAHVKPDILLGMDIWHDLNVRVERQLPSGFVLSNSRIGRMISGTGHIANPFSSNTVFALSVMNAESTVKTAKKDASGIENLQTEPEEPDKSKIVLDSTLRHESKTEEGLKNSSEFHLPEMEGTTQTDLEKLKLSLVAKSWDNSVSHLPTNNRLAKTRLASTQKKLRALGNVDKSQAILDEQLQKGIIKRVEKPKNANDTLHHLLHLPVNRSDKATITLRIVPNAETLSPNLPTQFNQLPPKDHFGIPLRFSNLKRDLLANNEMAFLQFPGQQASNLKESKALGISSTQLPAKMLLQSVHEADNNCEKIIGNDSQDNILAIMATWQTEPGQILESNFPLLIPWSKIKMRRCTNTSGHAIELTIYQISEGSGHRKADFIFAKCLAKASIPMSNEDDPIDPCSNGTTPKCLPMDEKGWHISARLNQYTATWLQSETAHLPGDQPKPESRENGPETLRRLKKLESFKATTVHVLRFPKNTSIGKHKFSGEEKTTLERWPASKGMPTSSELQKAFLLPIRRQLKQFHPEEKQMEQLNLFNADMRKCHSRNNYSGSDGTKHLQRQEDIIQLKSWPMFKEEPPDANLQTNLLSSMRCGNTRGIADSEKQPSSEVPARQADALRTKNRDKRFFAWENVADRMETIRDQ